MNQQTILQTLEKELSLDGLSEEVKQAIVTRLANTMLERVRISIAETLTEEEAEKVISMQQAGLISEVIDFLSEKHPGLDAQAEKITHEVIAEFLAA